MSPPPSYSVANNSIGGVLSGVVEADVGARKVDVIDMKKSPVPSPLLLVNSAKFNLEVPAATTIPSPLPSPARSASFVIRDVEGSQPPEHLTPRITSKSLHTSIGSPSLALERAGLPRLMIVSNTYTPNLEDELPIKMGDTVRMLEEFRDGWCVVQHVGEYNATKGVVPRICLQERKSVVPKHKSNSSLANSITGSLRR